MPLHDDNNNNLDPINSNTNIINQELDPYEDMPPLEDAFNDNDDNNNDNNNDNNTFMEFEDIIYINGRLMYIYRFI